MIERRGLLSYIQLVIHVVVPSGFIFAFILNSVSTEAVLYSIRPAAAKQYRLPFAPHYDVGYINSNFLPFKQKEPVYLNRAPLPHDNILQIEASDAIDSIKYSQPDIAYSLFNLNSGVKVPSSTFLKQKLLQTSAQNPIRENFEDQTFSTHVSENSMKPIRDIRYLDSAVDERTKSETGDLDYKLENNFKNSLHTQNTSNVYSQEKNNFTDSSDDIVYVSSDAVLSYEVPSTELNDSYDNSSVKQNLELVRDVPSLNSSDINSSTFSPVINTLSEYTTQNSISSNTHVYIEFVNQTNGNDSIMSSSVFPSTNNDSIASSLPSTDSEKKLSSGTVAGIVIAVLVSVTLLSSAVIYLLYRKFNGKCTSVVESKFNTDNCGYLDDSLRSSIYLNNHIELPKESSEEMTSLDNDSFLNSLETMTIQNYWADNSKNTKV